jgi:hypothetical protein
MVTQIRAVLARYVVAGGSVREEFLAGSGHAPFLDARDAWTARVLDVLGGVEG